MEIALITLRIFRHMVRFGNTFRILWAIGLLAAGQVSGTNDVTVYRRIRLCCPSSQLAPSRAQYDYSH